MCTVTIVPIGEQAGGFRMACSRDESHGRAAAQAPKKIQRDGVSFLMPIDPSSAGTWVAVNEHGLALTLLNYNLLEPPTGRDISRGDVIPSLLSARSVDEVLPRLESIERSRMMPFRLITCDGDSLMVWRSTEPSAAATVSAWSREPVMFTSSGLGDHLVEGPRRALFDGWFGDDEGLFLDRQLAFHRHQWPDRQHLSVCMYRETARTVSYTTVDVHDEQVRLVYHADRPDRQAKETIVDLQRRLVQR